MSNWEVEDKEKEEEEEEEEEEEVEVVVEREEEELVPPFAGIFLSSILFLEEKEASENISEILFSSVFCPFFNPWEVEDDDDDDEDL